VYVSNFILPHPHHTRAQLECVLTAWRSNEKCHIVELCPGLMDVRHQLCPVEVSASGVIHHPIEDAWRALASFGDMGAFMASMGSQAVRTSLVVSCMLFEPEHAVTSRSNIPRASSTCENPLKESHRAVLDALVAPARCAYTRT
jgi:hypothetical protein